MILEFHEKTATAVGAHRQLPRYGMFDAPFIVPLLPLVTTRPPESKDVDLLFKRTVSYLCSQSLKAVMLPGTC